MRQKNGNVNKLPRPTDMKSILRRLRSLIFLAATGVTCCCAHAQFAKPIDAVKYRQSVFIIMNTHTQRIGAAMKGEAPFDKTNIEAQAAIIEMLSKQLSMSFPSDSNMAPSKAKPEVWQDAVAFKKKMDEFQAAAAKLSLAARSSDMVAIKSSFNGMAQSCKACHEDFRNR